MIVMMANYKTYCGYDTETLYTLEDAEMVLRRRNQVITNTKRRTALYFLKQRLSGFVMLLAGIVCPNLLDGDATFSLIAVPLGIFLLFTRQHVMSFRQ